MSARTTMSVWRTQVRPSIIGATLLTLVSVVPSLPAAAAPCTGFTDVEASEPLCDPVTWLKNRAITLGCTGTTYCPHVFVTRGQIALFMQRLGRALIPETSSVTWFNNAEAVDLQNGQTTFICASDPIQGAHPLGTVGQPLQAYVHGLVSGIATAPVTWYADIWYSTDNGTNWTRVGGGTSGGDAWDASFQGATSAGATQATAVAQHLVPAGVPTSFAIGIGESPRGPDGTGIFSDVRCHLLVQRFNAG